MLKNYKYAKIQLETFHKTSSNTDPNSLANIILFTTSLFQTNDCTAKQTDADVLGDRMALLTLLLVIKLKQE